jgi:Tol biopolymer transport system component
MRTRTSLSRTLALALTTLAVGACSDATQPVAPAVPAAASLAKGGPQALPTNGRIYFTSNFAGGGPDVYSVNPDGSDRRRLTYTADDSEWSLDVSRDGKKLVTASHALGGTEGRIYTMNVDGSNRRLVTSRPDGLVSGPAWSPDGRAIAYASASLSNLNENTIWTVTASGGKVTQLTQPGLNASSPSWSPDGTRIVYSASPPGLGNENLYIVNADGSAAELLYDCVGSCTNPVWSRDGVRIYYVASGQGSVQIQYCALQQSGAICDIPLATSLTTFMFALSPDESQFVFRKDEVDISGLADRVATANLNGSAQTPITGNLTSITDLVWGR